VPLEAGLDGAGLAGARALSGVAPVAIGRHEIGEAPRGARLAGRDGSASGRETAALGLAGLRTQ
jgi:hypothetical protein